MVVDEDDPRRAGRSCRRDGLDAADREQRRAVVGVRVRVGDDGTAAARARRGRRSARARALGRVAVRPARQAPRSKHHGRCRSADRRGRRSTTSASSPRAGVQDDVLELSDVRWDLECRGHGLLDERVLALPVAWPAAVTVRGDAGEEVRLAADLRRSACSPAPLCPPFFAHTPRASRPHRAGTLPCTPAAHPRQPRAGATQPARPPTGTVP